jgi:hypothetical protein
MYYDDNVYFVDEMGTEYDRKFCLNFYETYYGWKQEANKFFEENREPSAELKNYQQFIQKKFEENILNDTQSEKTIKKLILNRLLKRETEETGSSEMDLVSLKYYGSYANFDEEDLEYPGGS